MDEADRILNMDFETEVSLHVFSLLSWIHYIFLYLKGYVNGCCFSSSTDGHVANYKMTACRHMKCANDIIGSIVNNIASLPLKCDLTKF